MSAAFQRFLASAARPSRFKGVGEVVEHLGVVQLERERPLKGRPALVEDFSISQDVAEVFQAGAKSGASATAAARRLFGFGEQAGYWRRIPAKSLK